MAVRDIQRASFAIFGAAALALASVSPAAAGGRDSSYGRGADGRVHRQLSRSLPHRTVVVARSERTLVPRAHAALADIPTGEEFCVWTTDLVGGTVPSTLALTLGTPASFGAFQAGVAKDYAATMLANVISTAGDATLSVTDPSATAPGHLVNGSFSLPSALKARAFSVAAAGGAFADVGGSAAPTALLSWSSPASNDATTIEFSQHIGATDSLRTGAYTKTLTFTLSTTTP